LKAAKAQNQGKGNLKRKEEEDLQEERRSRHSEAGAGPSSAAAAAAAATDGFDSTPVSIDNCTAGSSLGSCRNLAASFTTHCVGCGSRSHVH
jgi:hypothetical protein